MQLASFYNLSFIGNIIVNNKLIILYLLPIMCYTNIKLKEVLLCDIFPLQK